MRACIAGRDAELSVITRFLDSLVARPEILVLEGEPGIGKTTLWLAGAEQARERGFRVLSCRPSAAEARLSYASLADVLTGACDCVADALPGPQRRAIDLVLLRADDDGVVSDHRAAGADTSERRIRLAQHHFDAGDPVRARTLLEETAAGLATGAARGEALHLLAVVRLHDDSYRESAGYLQQALGEAGTDLRLRVRILTQLLFVLVNLGRIPDALRLTSGSVADAEQLGDPCLLARALAASVMIRFLSGHGLDEPALQRALDLEDPESPGPVMLRPALIASLLLAWTGRLDQARDRLLSIRQRCLDRGEESDLMFTAFHLVIVECWRGNLAGARLIAEDTLERAAQLGTGFPLAIALATRANVAAYTGQPGEARRAVREALTIFEQGSCLAVTVWPAVTLGFLEVSLGDHKAAAATLGPLAEAAAAMGYGEPTAAPFAPDAIEALIGVGWLKEASALADQLESNGRRLDRAWALALGARCRSLLLAATSDLDGAADAAERALVEHQRLPMPFERARTLLVLGQVQRRRRRKQAAAAALREAARIFGELGTPL
jgi:AAA ATPase domain